MANWKVIFEVDSHSYEANVKANVVDEAIEELRDHWRKISKFPVNIVEINMINHPQ